VESAQHGLPRWEEAKSWNAQQSTAWDEDYASDFGDGPRGDYRVCEDSLPIRIVVADDHPVVLAGVRAVLERSPDIKVVGEARNGDELIELLARQACEVIVTDYSMPGSRHGDGLPLIAMLAARYPHIPVIVQSMVSNVGVLRSLLGQGVAGLADKRATVAELADAVRSVVNRRTYISPSLLQRFERHRSGAPAGRSAKPSPREMEVFRLYVGGLSVSQIAERLNRSIKTVSTQKRQAMRKLGLEHDRDMVNYAREHGII
jgi:two-component system capsular synthesis response regulator RcsB